MDESQRRKLGAMLLLHREWAGWQSARLATLVRASAMVMSGTLSVQQVCRALDVSEATWHRWVRDLELKDLAADVVADIDRVLREHGASDVATVEDVKAAGVDVEGALLGIGVHLRG